MSGSEDEKGKEVFVCVIHNKEVYVGLHNEATLSACKEFLDEVLSGKRKTCDMYFAKGKVLKKTKYENKNLFAYDNEYKYEVLITKLYKKDETDLTTEGKCGSYSELWIHLGEYAKEQLLNGNPSRRKIINFER